MPAHPRGWAPVKRERSEILRQDRCCEAETRAVSIGTGREGARGDEAKPEDLPAEKRIGFFGLKKDMPLKNSMGAVGAACLYVCDAAAGMSRAASCARGIWAGHIRNEVPVCPVFESIPKHRRFMQSAKTRLMPARERSRRGTSPGTVERSQPHDEQGTHPENPRL